LVRYPRPAPPLPISAPPHPIETTLQSGRSTAKTVGGKAWSLSLTCLVCPCAATAEELARVLAMFRTNGRFRAPRYFKVT
jgi:hypothetical protein